MLKVKTLLIPIGGLSNPLLRDQALRANEEAKSLASVLRRQCMNDGCEEHPDEDSIVVVIAQWRGGSYMRKADFCCADFAQKYSFNLIRLPHRPVHQFTYQTATR